MKNLLTIIALCFLWQVDAQTNPVTNLSWNHWYETPNNYFTLEWEEPNLPHDDLLGYNIYRENELFLFVTETSIYNVEEGSNCGGEDFFSYGDGEGFMAYVTAVYNPGEVESTPLGIEVDGILLTTDPNMVNINSLHPNPTVGILNIEGHGLSGILIFDMYGKLVKIAEPEPAIDLSNLSKGIYFIKLISENGGAVKKIILK
ncbi:MAG TPA: T9SS type A sorting domain-containing protein [Flavobacteriaceae bacterium]|nr:T9SS type A sorting domain-containing protein [Flavobacteriaceae bacterium]HPF12039.1 T9SS type A sorting domain-containing protein [Flavobacteriaceae bacterium]HQU21317.1 T9SS type A sorting domain-containing protein [Flavobacteriaceae bacterium]HQU66526.1 T9SS type A sorting domain-containing protein [Flavobacteriaceae bacterium]HRW45277.1 T9SS type A sorting domain-containing protein [Flavobacteriaceae bacterium]